MNPETIYPESIDNLISRLSQLPSIGKKSAQRLAYFLLNQEFEKVEELADAILKAKSRIRNCKICQNYSENDKCGICNNINRLSNLICIVEKPSDIFLIERAATYRGVYHVLGGCLSPLDGIGPEQLNIASLIKRVKQLDSPELILALNTSSEGEATVMYLLKCFKNIPVKISRLARGIPVGSNLQFVDEITMQKSLENRVPV
jgi:recombination protein RecR